MWVAQIVVNHVLCRVIDKRIPSRASCHWTSDPVTVYVRSCKVFFRIQNMPIWLPQSKSTGFQNPDHLQIWGKLQAPNSSPAWPWSKIRTVGTFKTLKGGFTGFRRGAFCNTKKNSSVFAVSKKMGKFVGTYWNLHRLPSTSLSHPSGPNLLSEML